jgi:hypothetical protein
MDENRTTKPLKLFKRGMRKSNIGNKFYQKILYVCVEISQ